MTYQERVKEWMLACFPPEVLADPTERCFRFLEESLELCQARGITAEEAHRLVDYTFSRPEGHAPQEVGGVMVCLAALCASAGYDMDLCAELELSRINEPAVMDKVRAKHAAKPAGIRQPLPGEA